MAELAAVIETLKSLCQKGNWTEALSQTETYLKEKPNSPELWYQLGQIQDFLKYSDAQSSYEKVLDLAPEHAGAYNNLGVLAEQKLDYEKALKNYHQAHLNTPENAFYLRNLAQIYIHLGDREQAMYYAKKTLQQAQDWAPAYALFAAVLELFGQIEHAIAAYKQAILLDRHYIQAYYRLGHLYQNLRQFGDALNWYGKSIRAQAAEETRINHPLLAATYNMIAFCQREQGQISAAVTAYQKALQIYPLDSTRVSLSLLLPPVYQSREDLQYWRTLFQQGLNELENCVSEMQNPIRDVVTTPFYLAYQGLDDRSILERLADFYRPFLPENLVLHNRVSSDKIRIGFISNSFFNHSVSDYFAGIIQGLPRDSFEVFIFSTTQMQGDEVTESLRKNVDGFYQIAPDLDFLRQTIAQQTLDILVYPDIGMDPITYFLAFTRLAPVQCALMGHPITTGIPTMDYYLSSRHQETDTAEEHYSEKLIRLENIPAYYQRPLAPQQFKTRRELHLPNLGNIYLCTQTLYKIHPDFDTILQAILDQDRKAFILFFKEDNSVAHTYLQSRFQNSVPRKNRRIKFIPRVDFSDFLSHLYQADVVLDSIHFGGGSTSYLTFAMGTPIVTWPGEFLRGRTTYALYQAMGITQGIASDLDHYASLAVKIATDKYYRQELSEQIRNQNHSIFENQAAIDELSTFFKSLQP